MAKIKVSNVLFNILTIVTLIAAAFVAFNIFSGAKGYAVTSPSMKDTLNRGDIVFSRQVDFDSLEDGDIITVKVGNSGYFTHRIVSIDYDKRTVETKGDNNSVIDPMKSEEVNIVGKMWYSIPLMGYISIAFSGVSMYKGLIILAIAAIVLIALNMIFTKKNIKQKRGDINGKA